MAPRWWPINLAQFTDRAVDMHGVKKLWSLPMIGPKGETIAEYFVRTLPDGKEVWVRVPDVDISEPLATETVVRLCRSLKIPPHDFEIFIG